jgi:hypothetical protein
MDNNYHKANIEISGKVIGNNNRIDSIYVYYDERPTFFIYNQHKNDNVYDMGKLIADIVKQSPQLNQHNKQSSNYTLIRATKWWISTPLTVEIGRKESSQEQQQSIDIQFNISSLLKSEGVYTIVVYISHSNYDPFPVTSYSIFFW